MSILVMKVITRLQLMINYLCCDVFPLLQWQALSFFDINVFRIASASQNFDFAWSHLLSRDPIIAKNPSFFVVFLFKERCFAAGPALTAKILIIDILVVLIFCFIQR